MAKRSVVKQSTFKTKAEEIVQKVLFQISHAGRSFSEPPLAWSGNCGQWELQSVKPADAAGSLWAVGPHDRGPSRPLAFLRDAMRQAGERRAAGVGRAREMLAWVTSELQTRRQLQRSLDVEAAAEPCVKCGNAAAPPAP
ncbi:hypothetical protein UY3_07541 [Chelonia mydas]|uniref:Uncharacterized protein n=1 Tax=Chelonia mydas TaxID=8469 RepID=M7BDQ1_CHEMY|nr:hypothetical protein UY3_07541 [Chelonia mydas]